MKRDRFNNGSGSTLVPSCHAITDRTKNTTFVESLSRTFGICNFLVRLAFQLMDDAEAASRPSHRKKGKTIHCQLIGDRISYQALRYLRVIKVQGRATLPAFTSVELRRLLDG